MHAVRSVGNTYIRTTHTYIHTWQWSLAQLPFIHWSAVDASKPCSLAHRFLAGVLNASRRVAVLCRSDLHHTQTKHTTPFERARSCASSVGQPARSSTPIHPSSHKCAHPHERHKRPNFTTKQKDSPNPGKTLQHVFVEGVQALLGLLPCRGKHGTHHAR